MDKIKVYTAITDRDTNKLVDEFLDEFDFCHVGQTQFGLDCAHAVAENCPDVIISGIHLYDTDAFGLFSMLKQKGITSNCVFAVVSGYGSSQILGKLLDTGVDTVVLSPFNFIEFDSKLRSLVNNKKNGIVKDDDLSNSQKQRVSTLLQSLALSPKGEGYNCIKHSILLSLNDSSYLRAFTAKLYPEVARICGKTPGAVEAIMRHTIERSWEKSPLGLTESIFGFTVDDGRARPTVSQYISTLVEHLNNEF